MPSTSINHVVHTQWSRETEITPSVAIQAIFSTDELITSWRTDVTNPRNQNTRARLGRVTPLGRPRSVYKSDVECRFFSQNGKGPWRSRSMTFILSYQLRESQDAYLVILAHIHYKLLYGQAKFPRILSQNCQNNLEGQGQWPPFSISAESISGCMFAANLVILSRICDELSCGQAEFPGILSQNDLEVQGQWPLFSIPAESAPWCMFGANLVNSAQICDELSCGQGKVYGQTDGRTDGKRCPASTVTQP